MVSLNPVWYKLGLIYESLCKVWSHYVEIWSRVCSYLKTLCKWVNFNSFAYRNTYMYYSDINIIIIELSIQIVFTSKFVIQEIHMH